MIMSKSQERRLKVQREEHRHELIVGTNRALRIISSCKHCDYWLTTEAIETRLNDYERLRIAIQEHAEYFHDGEAANWCARILSEED